MRIFVTGATGFIGSAVVQELLGAGHRVLGLARSDAAAALLLAAGAEVHRGSLDALDHLQRGAAESDGVVHTAFNHDFTTFVANCQTDKLAIDALGAGLKGSGRPLIGSSGILVLPSDRLATEDDVPAAVIPRLSESSGLAQAAHGIRAMAMRLPPSVHGDGDHGFVPHLITVARQQGFSAYVGTGENRWPAVHRLDAARLYRLALEKGVSGARFHAVADEGVPVRQIAEAIGRRLNLPVVSKSPEEAAAIFGFIGHVLGMNAAASSKLTQDRMGWHPTQPGLLADLEHGTYFDPR